jgi:hypothetical protein
MSYRPNDTSPLLAKFSSWSKSSSHCQKLAPDSHTASQRSAVGEAGLGHQHACCRSHSHDKSNPVTGRNRRIAANGESVPEADECSAAACGAYKLKLFDHLIGALKK